MQAVLPIQGAAVELETRYFDAVACRGLARGALRKGRRAGPGTTSRLRRLAELPLDLSAGIDVAGADCDRQSHCAKDENGRRPGGNQADAITASITQFGLH